MVGIEHQFVAQDVTRACACQVEVAVVGEVDRGRRIGSGRVVNAKFVIIRQSIDHFDRQVTRVALLLVWAQVVQLQGRPFFGFQRFGLPDDFIEPLDPTVQMVGTVVSGEYVLLPFECELTAGDTVAHAADNGAEIRMAFQVFLQGIESQHDVLEIAVTVRHFKRHHDAAVVGNPGFKSVFIGQCVKMHAKRLLLDTHVGLFLDRPRQPYSHLTHTTVRPCIVWNRCEIDRFDGARFFFTAGCPGKHPAPEHCDTAQQIRTVLRRELWIIRQEQT